MPVTANSRRKSAHIRACLDYDVQADGVTPGWGTVRLIHQALPEISFADIDTSASFCGKKLSAPLLISAMTGGTTEAALINRNLALAAQTLGLGLALGSQRPAIEDESLAATYQVRDIAPDILLFANLGAVQLNKGYGLKQCRRAVDMIQADALVLHLNPLQESLQEGGDLDFSGLAEKIGEIADYLPVPVIVKEVGWGISERVAQILVDQGIHIIDVAGAGGTSWSAVESRCSGDDTLQAMAAAFTGWGIPTVTSISNVRRISKEIDVIASGGIRTGVDIAKALALGANVAGVALPLLEPACQSEEKVILVLRRLIRELRIAMFCTASRRIADLSLALANNDEV